LKGFFVTTMRHRHQSCGDVGCFQLLAATDVRNDVLLVPMPVRIRLLYP
jgi:hypothetical protein